MSCPRRFQRHPPTFWRVESISYVIRYAHAGFRVWQCLYVTLMQVLEFLVNTSYFLDFTIHIVLNPSVMAVGASSFLRHLYALPMHVWENLYWSYNCVMFHLQWGAATSCLYVTPMHVFVLASAQPTLEPCKSLKISTFGQIQAVCADANLHRRYMTLWEFHFS